MFNPAARRRFALGLAFALLTPWLPARSQNPAPASTYFREFGYIPLSDGVRIAYVAYRPSQDGKYPAIMQYDPYIAAGSGPSTGWLDKGYAYIGVSVRGTGCSQGDFSFLNGESHGADGAEVVNWKALIEHDGYPGVREKGLLRLEGKEYIVKDGDVLVIRHG